MVDWMRVSMVWLLVAALGGCSSQESKIEDAAQGSNRAPRANFELAGEGRVGEPLVLDASASVDEDGDALSFVWMLAAPSGSAALLEAERETRSGFTPDIPGRYTVSLLASDGHSLSDAAVATVQITGAAGQNNASPTNAEPQASARASQPRVVGQPVWLDASASTDPDDEVLSYAWELVQRPATSAAVLEGDARAVAVLVPDVVGSYAVGLSVRDARGASAQTEVVLDVLPATGVPSHRPVADAGADQGAMAGQLVGLDGLGSTSVPPGMELAYYWELVERPEGSVARLWDATLSRAYVQPDVAGTYRLELVVHDGQQVSAPDEVLVVASGVNSAPVAVLAETEYSAYVGEALLLDASPSRDEQSGEELDFRWTLVSRPADSAVALQNASASRARLTPDADGVYVVELVVSDGLLSSAPQRVVIVSRLRDYPPRASLGTGYVGAYVGQTVVLDGTDSVDAEGAELSFQWTILSKPAQSSVRLQGAQTATPSLTVDARGMYEVQLVVRDGTQVSSPATVQIEASYRPVAVTEPPVYVLPGVQVELSGANSHDLDGDPLNWRWRVLDGPVGSRPELRGADGPRPMFQAARSGLYVLELVVDDGVAASMPAMQFVYVNTPPTAVAEVDSHVATGSELPLDGQSSWDVDGDSLRYQWTLVHRPAGSQARLYDSTTAIGFLITDVAGEYTLSLAVDDGVQSSPVQEFVILANHRPVARGLVDDRVLTGDVLELSAQGSSDGDGHALAYAWRLVSAPSAAEGDVVGADESFALYQPVVSGRYEFELVVHDGFQSSVAAMFTVVANQAPVASAVEQPVVRLGESILLDATQSFDGDGDVIYFNWTMIERPNGSQAEVANPVAKRTVLTPDVAGVYVVALVVDDLLHRSDPVPVEVIVNRAPVADAGPNRRGNLRELLLLDGSDSVDLDGDRLWYQWSLVSAPAANMAQIVEADQREALFEAELPGNYVFDLVVWDGYHFSEPDRLIVSFAEPGANARPVADAGPPQSVSAGGVVALDGRESFDADGDLLSFQWSVVQAPAGSLWRLLDAETPQPVLSTDKVGAYVLELLVGDGVEWSDVDVVVVSAVNTPPQADAGPGLVVDVGMPAVLDGTASVDLDGHFLEFQWRVVQAPPGSQAVLADAQSPIAMLLPDVAGEYAVELVVHDGHDDSSGDIVVIQAITPPADCLVFSEYLEGSGVYNKAVELYNCGSRSVDLAKFGICLAANEATSCSASAALAPVMLTPGSVWTLCRSRTGTASNPLLAEIGERCDQVTASLMQHTGDDRLLLFLDGDANGQFDESLDTRVDAFGQTSVQPATELWKDRTYERCNLETYTGLEPFDASVSYRRYAKDYAGGFGFAPTLDCAR